MVTLGIVKYWLLDCVSNALYAFPKGPDDCEVGADDDAVSAPSFPDTSPKKFVGLKG